MLPTPLRGIAKIRIDEDSLLFWRCKKVATKLIMLTRLQLGSLLPAPLFLPLIYRRPIGRDLTG